MSGTRVILAEFFCTDDRTLLFLVREDFQEPVVVELGVSQRNLRDFVTQHFGAGRAAGGDVTKTIGRCVSSLDETAFQTFLEPFLKPLIGPAPDGGPITKPGDVIWFVPHDAMHYLPLHAVKLEGKYLIERNPICYSPSASVMKSMEWPPKSGRQVEFPEIDRAEFFDVDAAKRKIKAAQGALIEELEGIVG